MPNLKRLAVAGVTATTIVVVSALGASATSFGAQVLTTLESRFAAALQTTGGSVAAFDADVASGVLHPFGQFVSSLAHSIPPGPMHGKLVSSFARHMNPSNFNNPNSHGREGAENRHHHDNDALPPQAQGRRP